MTVLDDLDQPPAVLRELGRELMVYKFAVDELMTKLRILSEEFDFAHQHDPIEHLTSRVKQPEAILRKLRRKGIEPGIEAIREHIEDVAGIRVVCPFVPDVYEVARMLGRQDDVEVVRTKDYIAEPKPNGYRSLHLIVRIPVFLSDRVVKVKVEIQMRTIAMDFWAAVEHKLFYKYDGEAPEDFAAELHAAAATAADLDSRMTALHQRLRR
ncbi:putative GTP pyrophosphokinase [Amycolatopsis bartoniae]|uniref:GTP pyrophosphokinase n=1 Tax=Amycolatopsis bartoniae TaxID=941986 RepID=A0A8H9IZZ6_9PSEU|nr:GTP pyrophosphokinase family protein [Amycolatopsis bartoniae]MBB2933105.1 putative GTP pyrophosphokinase [Amycolatopsis bartoniae]TVT11892.1 GTP pyrophosphokinase family protein [Amycolatopsis bartoniae]GHF57111.1 GTP pyrophosphokinase [Amycolatopsis bartoniae]